MIVVPASCCSSFVSWWSLLWLIICSSYLSWSCLRTLISFDSCTLLLKSGCCITCFVAVAGDLIYACNDACFLLLLLPALDSAGDANDAVAIWTRESWSSDPVLLILSSGVLKSSDDCVLILPFTSSFAACLIASASASAFLDDFLPDLFSILDDLLSFFLFFILIHGSMIGWC